MLDDKGFDMWADGYDKSVGLSDESDSYPFAGYRKILNEIYTSVLDNHFVSILDIGFGTGTLAARLYGQGCSVWGQDFSQQMIKTAREKMPEAGLYQGDFSKGLAAELKARRYDAIIAAYSLHHLTDDRKISFINELITLLNPGGRIYIGDVAFNTEDELRQCRLKAGGDWDDDEIYFIFDTFKEHFTNITFRRFSDCAGLIELY